jgi:hypothetical protein
VKKEKFKYDVAFSFLAEDEKTATEINDLLKGRLTTFLYSEKQKEIAGKDGEKTLNDVFSKEARIVVVIYRKNWGSTPWTRIEETAIRNRGHEEGYDFTFFIPIDTSYAAPKWLPKNRIWFDLEKWGIEGAASAVEARIQEAGGEPHEESIQDRMASIERKRAFDKKREEFLFSKAGVEKADKEIQTLFSVVKENAKSIAMRVDEVPSKTWLRHVLNISREGYWVSLDWEIKYQNTLSGTNLIVTVFKGYPPQIAGYQFLISSELSSEVFNFDIDINENLCWKSEDSGEDFSTRKLAEYCIGLLIDRLE